MTWRIFCSHSNCEPRRVDCRTSKGNLHTTPAKMEDPIGVEDMITIDVLTDESLLKNIQVRFENKKIYVWIVIRNIDA